MVNFVNVYRDGKEVRVKMSEVTAEDAASFEALWGADKFHRVNDAIKAKYRKSTLDAMSPQWLIKELLWESRVYDKAMRLKRAYV